MNAPMARKAWLEYLQKAVDEFDWGKEWEQEPDFGAQPAQEQNFCPRCGKRTKDIHTCTPPKKTYENR